MKAVSAGATNFPFALVTGCPSVEESASHVESHFSLSSIRITLGLHRDQASTAYLQLSTHARRNAGSHK